MKYILNNILDCIKKTKKQREFEEKLQADGVRREIEKNFEVINATIISKELAIKFVLQELDMAQNSDTVSQNFVKNSGFQAVQYQDTLEKFKSNETELSMVEFIFSDFLENISNKKLMAETTIILIDKIMYHWKIGKYEIEKNSNEISIKEEEEREKEEVAPIVYDTQKINSLMEEYSDIIENIIKGQHNNKEQLRIQKFKEHMSIAGEAGNSIATVFCCFYKQEESLNLPIPIEEMSEESIKFFIEILDTFYREGFSEPLMDYLEENHNTVWELANNENKYMQYLIGLWYICDEMTPSECLNAQKVWYEQSANNGFGLAVRKLQKLTLQE